MLAIAAGTLSGRMSSALIVGRPGEAESPGRSSGSVSTRQTSGNKPRGARRRAPPIYIYNPNYCILIRIL